MRGIIGLLGSIGIGALMTAAGLVYDAQTLTFFGFGTLGLICALYIYNWSIAAPAKSSSLPVVLRTDMLNLGASDDEKAIFSLGRAQENARIAISAPSKQRQQLSRQAYNEYNAALLTISKEFGIGRLSFKGAGTVPYESALRALIAYGDKVYPLLRDGHIEEARKAASSFRWKWGGS